MFFCSFKFRLNKRFICQMISSIPIIKVDATDSTNELAKSILFENQKEGNFCVYTPNQLRGKGQMGAKWTSEPNKNLTFSLVIRNINLPNTETFFVSILVSLAVIQTLEKQLIPQLKLKWPNDILSGGKKIGGILIENNLKQSFVSSSIIGIGLNLNQLNFDGLPKASSLKLITGKTFVIEEMLDELLQNLVKIPFQLKALDKEVILQKYQNHLFRFKQASMFQLNSGEEFVGIIQKITPDGKLVLLLEDEKEASFEVKEIALKY